MPLVLLEIPEVKDHRVQQDLRVQLELVESRVSPEPQVLLAQQANLDSAAPTDKLDHLVPPEILEPLVIQEILDNLEI